MTEVLFEITKDSLETGLRGFPIGYCVTSTVDPQTGLLYTGLPANALLSWEPEEVIYLLYHGKKGSPDEIKRFKDDLRKRSSLSPKVVEHIQKLPKEGHPMALFTSALLICGMLEGKNDYREDCLNLIAKGPEIAATVITYHAGWKKNPSQPNLGYVENFTQMLNMPNSPNLTELNQVFKLFNILHYDHGGGNLSTFVGKAVASSLEDLYGSMAAAMTALAGPRHGKANQDCLEFVKKLSQEIKGEPTPEQLENLIRKKLANNELIYGFGHAVLRVEDPRATIFYDVAKEKYANDSFVKIATHLRTVGPKVLKENPKIANPYPNVDAISGIVLSAAGFPYPEYFTVLFGLSRIVGIGIQIVYERCEARDGKGTPIVRPKYLYKSR